MKKTVLITGASRGIGRAAAQLFGREGLNVAVNYRANESAARSLCAELSAMGCGAATFRADVADRAQVDAMVEAAQARFGGIDVLVCSAGIAQDTLFTDITADEWQRMLAVNLTGVFHCCQAVLPGMLHQKRGSIVTVSSMWGETGASCEAAYSAAKAGVIGLTKALAKELGPSGIRVNCVAPGVIDTDMNAGYTPEELAPLLENAALGRAGSALEAARAIVYLAGEGASYITGQVLGVNGGLIL